MAEKKFRNWIGYKEEQSATPSENSVDRIRQLESQLSDLRSRKDITSLSKEEFEILATETAMALIKTAQQRESRALAAAERMVSETTAAVRAKLESAESKAKSILSGAESRGRKYLEAAEIEATELKDKVTRQTEAMLTETKREANALANAGRREAERLISEAKTEITNFRLWLTTAITESERLYRVQTQSLNAAEQAIAETRAKLTHAFERLANLQSAIDTSLTEDNTPVRKTLSGKESSASKSEKKGSSKKRR